MTETFKDPKDLASAVLTTLKRIGSEEVSIDVLTMLFQTMYHVSMKTEEGESLRIRVVFMNPDEQERDKPQYTSADRWSFVALEEPLPFATATVAKIAMATDPRSSSIAVYPDENDNLLILGLVDQAHTYYNFINYEAESGPTFPGLFEVTVESTGCVSVSSGYKKVAELRVGRLVKFSPDVLSRGPVCEFLNYGMEKYISQVRGKVGEEIYNDRDHWDATLSNYWMTLISRILLRIRRYNHGGALLIKGHPSNSYLNIKHEITYKRLQQSSIRRGSLTIESTYAEDKIMEQLDEEELEAITSELYLDAHVFSDRLKNVRSELDGALWFVSLLSRVDGLVLLSKAMIVKGFGVEIKIAEPPPSVFVSRLPNPNVHQLKEMDYNHFGTRHRSMMRYCWKYPKSLGLVVSQDGDVRAIKRVKDKLILWESIKIELQPFIAIKKRKRKKK